MVGSFVYYLGRYWGLWCFVVFFFGEVFLFEYSAGRGVGVLSSFGWYGYVRSSVFVGI